MFREAIATYRQEETPCRFVPTHIASQFSEALLSPQLPTAAGSGPFTSEPNRRVPTARPDLETPPQVDTVTRTSRANRVRLPACFGRGAPVIERKAQILRLLLLVAVLAAVAFAVAGWAWDGAAL